MTVDEMILWSRILVVLACVFFILAVIVFFAFDVGRSWRILNGKKITTKKQSDKGDMESHQSVPVAMDEQTRELTERLITMQQKTTLLVRQSQEINNMAHETDILTSKNISADDVKITTDITLVHTDIIL